MRPEDMWGEWHCPLCTTVIRVNPYDADGGFPELRMHTAAHVEADDDYLMGLY